MHTNKKERLNEVKGRVRSIAQRRGKTLGIPRPVYGPRRLHGRFYGGASPSNTSASKKPRMEQTESSEPLTKARFSATPKLKHLTAFEAAPFIKPPALRGVSDLLASGSRKR